MATADRQPGRDADTADCITVGTAITFEQSTAKRIGNKDRVVALGAG